MQKNMQKNAVSNFHDHDEIKNPDFFCQSFCVAGCIHIEELRRPHSHSGFGIFQTGGWSAA